MKLIIGENLAERHWIKWLFSDIATSVELVTDYQPVDGPAIIAIDSNHVPLAQANCLFRTLRAHSNDLTLFHCADEFLAGGLENYRYFNRVIRFYHSWIADGPGILTLPLGWANLGTGPQDFAPTGQRKLLWSFAGEVKASRVEMVRGLQSVGPSLVHDTIFMPRLDRTHYIDLLLDSIFLPCPMGNVVLETWRLYEALEFGCIPIVERRATLDYYRHLFGDHPLITVGSWSEAASEMKRLVRQPDELVAKQREIVAWWRDQKVFYRSSVAQFMKRNWQPELLDFSSKFRHRQPLPYQGLRIAELLRHQTASSMRRRVQRLIG